MAEVSVSGSGSGFFSLRSSFGKRISFDWDVSDKGDEYSGGMSSIKH